MKKMFFLIVVAGLLVVACEENLEPDKSAYGGLPVEEEPAGVRMIVPPVLFGDATKVTMSVNESTGLSFLWSTGDQSGVYPADVVGLGLFTLVSGGGTGSASFDGGGFSLTDTKSYYALYPYNGNATDKAGIPLDFSDQVVTADNDVVSPMTRDYMWAEAVAENGKASFSFSHIGSFVRLKLVGLTAGANISRVQLIPMYGQITDAASFNIASQTVTETATTPSRDIDASVTVPDGGTSTIWTVMAPQDFSADHFAVAATIDGNLYSARLAGKNQLAGKAYRWDVSPLAATSAPAHGFSPTVNDQVQMAVTSGQYSGICYIGSNGDGTYNFAVVDDKLKGGGIIFFKIPIGTDGSVNAEGIEMTVPSGTSGSSVTGRDNEDIVFDGINLWVSAEKDQSIRQYSLSDGSVASASFSIPADMTRSCLSSTNAGFEALTYNTVTGKFWTTTELPLTKDSFLPQLHRFQRFDADQQADARYLYQTDAPTVSSSDISSAKSYVFGIPALTALDDGRLIVLEREVYVPNFSGLGDIQTVQEKAFTRMKLYVVAPGTDNAGILRKTLLTEFTTHVGNNLLSSSLANYEGMCLGPALGGRQSLVLIPDSQGGMNTTFMGHTFNLTHEFIKIILL